MKLLIAAATAVALIATPVLAGGKSGRAAGFSQHEMNNLGGTLTGRVLSWFVVQTASGTGSGSGTGTGTGTSSYGGGSFSKWILEETDTGKWIRIRIEGPKMQKNSSRSYNTGGGSTRLATSNEARQYRESLAYDYNNS